MNPRVLVAEDNALMAEMALFNLQRAGLEVTLARSGDEAVIRLATEAFDVVITDYQMPGRNGEAVCRFARESELNRDAHLILCSAKGYELDLDGLTREYQLAEVLFKPFSPRGLVARIRQLLARNSFSPNDPRRGVPADALLPATPLGRRCQPALPGTGCALSLHRRSILK